MMLVNQALQDPNQALMYALILVIATNLIQYFLQNRHLNRQTEHIKMQLETSSKNLEKQLAQNEKNIRIQLLHPDQKESVDALWSILFNTEGGKLKKELTVFLDEKTEGFYLPSDIQTIIRSEIFKVDNFLREKAIESGEISLDQDAGMLQLYDEWYNDLDQWERSQVDIEVVYERFEARIKDQIRKYTSISE